MKANVLAKAQILSTGVYLPPQIVTSDYLLEEIDSERQYGIPLDYLSKEMGIIERRVSDHGTLPSELAIKAAQEAMGRCPDLNPDDIDAVIFCGIERDHPEPATAHVIQHALGLKANYVFDVSNACFGFLDGLRIASVYITAGLIKQALVVTGEVSSTLLWEFTRQLKRGMSAEDARLRIGALTVGDAGGAMLLGGSYGYDCSGFEVFNHQVDSAHVEKCVYKIKKDGSMEGQMEMAKLTAANLRMQRRMFAETLQQTGWSEFDWLLTHQIGNRYFEKLEKITGVSPDRMIKTFDKLGNITTATLPVGYDRLLNSAKVAKGSRIVGCFAGSGQTAGQFGYTS
ncbi:MAG: 3-oxoacyl-[acyl-carrier-protein] synthase-3 [Arenicella sp.]|jgi:3-oxoacyl-[acyl-carrier-protein] synthase-3